MFLAYDKVHHSQYEFYVQYAETTPGEETKELARDILYSLGKHDDEVVTGLYEQLTQMLNQDGVVPVEYFLFPIRSVDGDTFDVYLLDEDGLFQSVAVGVAQNDVLNAGKGLLTGLSWYAKSKAYHESRKA
jgi:hypothetical protein